MASMALGAIDRPVPEGGQLPTVMIRPLRGR